jgi:hypothetical protein
MSDDAHSGVVRVRAAQQLLDRSGFGREQTWRVEATARTESVVDTVRVRDARATGDPQKLLMAMQEDTEELRVILGALIQSGGVP